MLLPSLLHRILSFLSLCVCSAAYLQLVSRRAQTAHIKRFKIGLETNSRSEIEVKVCVRIANCRRFWEYRNVVCAHHTAPHPQGRERERGRASERDKRFIQNEYVGRLPSQWNNAKRLSSVSRGTCKKFQSTVRQPSWFSRWLFSHHHTNTIFGSSSYNNSVFESHSAREYRNWRCVGVAMYGN